MIGKMQAASARKDGFMFFSRRQLDFSYYTTTSRIDGLQFCEYQKKYQRLFFADILDTCWYDYLRDLAAWRVRLAASAVAGRILSLFLRKKLINVSRGMTRRTPVGRNS